MTNGAREPGRAAGPAALLAAAGVLLLVVIAYALGRKTARMSRFGVSNTHPVVAGDGWPYQVHREHPDQAGAAEAMAEIHRRTVDLMRSMRARHVRGAAPAAERSARRTVATENLLARFNPDTLVENSPLDPSGDTSYTIDKGAVLAVCLRDRLGAHDLHDIETTMFVMVHELSHLATDAQDHPPLFWETFRFLLEEALAAGVLRFRDYEADPVYYCGLFVNYTPLTDATLARPLLGEAAAMTAGRAGFLARGVCSRRRN